MGSLPPVGTRRRALKLTVTGGVLVAWLIVGCGERRTRKEGYVIYLDVRPGVGDVTGDVRCLPFAPDSLDLVECSHVLEHLERDEAPGALAEIWRVLVPGGLLDIAVPDLLCCAQSLLNGVEQVLQNIYSPAGEPAQRHRWGYTPASLQRLLGAGGFVAIAELPLREPHEMRYQAKKGEAS